MMSCIFCDIINGTIESDIIYESENVIAFKDINPLAPVHILVTPKKHIEQFHQVNDLALYGELMDAINRLVKNFELDKTGYRIVCNNGKDGKQEVSHLHFHILGGGPLTKTL